MDQDLRAYLDERFQEIRQEVGAVRDESRQTRILVEDLHGNVQLLAEGVMGLTEKLEEHRAETRLGFENVKASIVPYYQNLNERMGILEERAERQTQDVLEVIRKKFGKR
jgi:hypothetical protein